jgi:hypothetical protein
MKPNGADAKDIAVKFLDLTGGRATSHIMARMITQAKNILAADYTKDEIIAVMEYVILVKKVDVYSFGYFNTCIDVVLREIRINKEREDAKQSKQAIQKELASVQESQRDEVSADDDSTRRNQEKARRLSVQPRFGAKFDFDLLKGHGQDH